uniref:Uncharacterized protein n=1 Tax=Anguilla anguilla TaxID=7936 RepID=A0A0E9PW03_ANGAN
MVKPKCIKYPLITAESLLFNHM